MNVSFLLLIFLICSPLISTLGHRQEKVIVNKTFKKVFKLVSKRVVMLLEKQL